MVEPVDPGKAGQSRAHAGQEVLADLGRGGAVDMAGLAQCAEGAREPAGRW